MKKLIVLFISIIGLIVLIYFNPVAAEERFIEIEMADGNTVSFPMTAEEIVAEDAKMAKLDILKKKRSITPKKEVILVEMADGNFAEFPVKTKDNTTSSNAETNASDQNC